MGRWLWRKKKKNSLTFAFMEKTCKRLEVYLIVENIIHLEVHDYTL